MIFLLLFATQLLAFPENVRLGYSSCSTCHVSPSGGGVLKPYGRGLSEEISTFSIRGEGQAFEGLGTPEWLNIGSDIRYLSKNENSEHVAFTMQSELELALTFMKGVTLDYSAGRYGPNQTLEYRRNYLLFDVNDYISFRAGSFIPSFGLGIPDHTTLIRTGLGFGEGSETYNGEAVVRSQYGELFFTYVLGKEGDLHLQNRQKQPSYTTDDDKALAVKLSTFSISKSVLGLNFLKSKLRTIYGIYIIAGLPYSFYLLGEFDVEKAQLDKQYVSHGTLGYEVYKGVHLLAESQYLSKSPIKTEIFGAGLSWYPRPHMEIVSKYNYEVVSNSDTLENEINHEYYLMWHYYL